PVIVHCGAGRQSAEQSTMSSLASQTALPQTINEPVFVDEGDTIRTDRTGLAYLLFFEGTESEIKANTWVIVTTLELPAEEDDDLSIALDVLVGATLTSVEAALDPEDRFEIHTPSATAVVRGTRWWTIVDRDGQTTFIVEEGTVWITFNQGEESAPEIELPAGRGVVITSGEASEPADDLTPPADPDPAPLADPTCGNSICEDNESCPLDCDPPPTTCGNAVCDANEDIVLCSADCLPAPQCTITGDNINIRSGPDTAFPVVTVLNPGKTLSVIGRNQAGTWLVVSADGVNSWVARSVVTLSGICDNLTVFASPPPPPTIPDTTTAEPETGTWGACGSCDYCGEYPAIECMTSPDGSCVWNPAVCRKSAGPAGPGTLSVGASQFDCIAPADITVTATYTPPLESPGAVLASYSAVGDSLSPVNSYYQTSPTSFNIDISCNIPGYGSVTATATDSNGLSYSTSFTVWVQG
ncbi:MAG TPA: SH3 domain-containing protein, partial [Aggregatilineaceae bacterium]|nr:SH3 domain-containing protein [Aggregatilineaceae bacterium]